MDIFSNPVESFDLKTKAAVIFSPLRSKFNSWLMSPDKGIVFNLKGNKDLLGFSRILKTASYLIASDSQMWNG